MIRLTNAVRALLKQSHLLSSPAILAPPQDQNVTCAQCAARCAPCKTTQSQPSFFFAYIGELLPTINGVPLFAPRKERSAFKYTAHVVDSCRLFAFCVIVLLLLLHIIVIFSFGITIVIIVV